MIKDIESVFLVKRVELMEKRDSFSYENDDRKIASIESQLNEAVAQRNDKKSFYDRYEKQIKKLDDTYAHLEDIVSIEEV